MKLGNQKNKERTSIITLLPLLGADVPVISQKKTKTLFVIHRIGRITVKLL